MMLRRKGLPKVSIIIPVRPQGEIKAALKALSRLDYPAEPIEVFICRGHNPSRQRNQAAGKARGEIFYFLDNDSEIEKKAFKRVVAAFSGKKTPVRTLKTRGFSFFPTWISRVMIDLFFSAPLYKGEVGAVGGPNVWRRGESFWASMTGAALGSFFAHSKMAARYRPIGPVHRATEKELILCNLAVRGDIFKKVGGFNEVLYPNEENELLNRIKKAGYQLIYHPGVLAFRPHRNTFGSLLGAFFHYGRGRMEQIRVEGVWQSLPVLMPLFLFGYLVGLGFFHPWFAFLPLILYLGMSFGSALGFALRREKAFLVIFLPPLFLLVHLTYAVGLIYGLVTNLEKKRRVKRRRKIKIFKAKSFGQNWQEMIVKEGLI